MTKEKPGTKLCRYCKTEIPYGAIICPNCRKKQKKNGCLIAVLIVVAIGIVACFASSPSDPPSETAAIAEVSRAAKDGSLSSEDDGAEAALDDQESADTLKTQDSIPDQKGDQLPTIEEQVLLEWEGLRVTAKELTQDIIWGKGLKVLIENKSGKDLGVSCNALIIDDYMITDLFSQTVAPGKKANTTIYFSSSALEAAGLTDIGQIEIYFHVFDGNSYSALHDADKVVLQTSSYGKADAVDDIGAAGKELLDAAGVKVIGQYVDENSFWGKALLLYIENDSGKNIGISCDNMSVNGFMVTPLFSSTIYDGKKALDDITLFSSELEENGIDEIHEAELTFRIYDADNYQTIFESDPISFTIE